VVVKIEMAALAGLHLKLYHFGLTVAAHPERLAGLDGVQDANQSLCDAILERDLTGYLFFAALTGGNKNPGPPIFLGQSLRFGFDRFGRAVYQLAKVLNENAACIQICFHHLGTIQLPQGSSQPESVEPSKNS
jgi:hypothetical protein